MNKNILPITGERLAAGGLVMLLIVASICLTACHSNRAPSALPAPADAEMVEYKQQPPQEWTLDNGLTVVYLPDDEIPVVRGSLYLRGGSLWEPESMPGIISVMGDQMRQGGAGLLSADALDLELEKLAAGISSGYDGEFGTISFSSLSADFPRLMELVRDVVRAPRFQQDRLDLWKGQALESIRRRVDDPSTVAGIAFKKLAFGDSVLGKVLVEEDVRRMDRLDLLRMHRQFVKPRGAYLAVTGNIDRTELERIAEKNFGDWEGSFESDANSLRVSYSPTPGVYFIELPFSQSTVYMGHQGPPRLSPDFIAIEGFNSVFGSGDFGSRMMRRIRSELGLAYAVYGGVIAGFPIGQTLMVLQTKSESTAPAVSEALKVLQQLQTDTVSSAELEQAKMSIQSSFVFRLDTPDDVVRRTVLLRLLDYPPDYDLTYLDKVRNMNKREIQEVATGRWRLPEFVTVVVGNENAYNSLKQHLESDTGVLGSLPFKRCAFKEVLGACQ